MAERTRPGVAVGFSGFVGSQMNCARLRRPQCSSERNPAADWRSHRPPRGERIYLFIYSAFDCSRRGSYEPHAKRKAIPGGEKSPGIVIPSGARVEGPLPPRVNRARRPPCPVQTGIRAPTPAEGGEGEGEDDGDGDEGRAGSRGAGVWAVDAGRRRTTTA